MPFKMNDEVRAEGVGWYQSGIWNTRELLERLGNGDLGHVEEEMPDYDSRYETYKITVIVEKQ